MNSDSDRPPGSATPADDSQRTAPYEPSQAISPEARKRCEAQVLWALLGVQNQLLDRRRLLEVLPEWQQNKQQSLGKLLLDRAAIAPDAYQLLNALAKKHLELHGNDPERSLADLSALGSFRAELERVADADVYATVAYTPTETDAMSTAGTVRRPGGSRFRIIKPHARGGLGEVFVAKDEELDREVALKEIQSQYGDHAESRARFLKEAEITDKLEHPGIVPVYGLGTYADGRPYYAMRFIQGDSLKEAIDRFHANEPRWRDRDSNNELKFRKLLQRFVDVCHAIEYAHSKGVLHRDLKPGNVMLGQYGETLVVDWGLAKHIGDKAADEPQSDGESKATSHVDENLTQHGQALGTPAFMSPEQAAGRLEELGPATDVYGLGATLYYLLTGEPPLRGGEFGNVVELAQFGLSPARKPRAVYWKVPRALEAVCLKAMARKPNDRYAGPRELAEDIERWLADKPVTVYRESRFTRIIRFVATYRLALAFLGLTVAAFAIIISSTSRTREQELQKQRQQAEYGRGLLERAAIMGDYAAHVRAAQTALESGDLNAATKQLLACQTEVRGWEFDQLTGKVQALRLVDEQLSANPTTCGGNELLRFPFGPVTHVAVSANGRRVAACANAQIKIVGFGSSHDSRTLSDFTSDIRSLALSPDGDRLVVTDNATVRLFDAATGIALQTIDAKGINSASLASEGQQLIGSFPNGIRIWEATTGRVTLSIKTRSESAALSVDGSRILNVYGDSAELLDSSTGKFISKVPLKDRRRTLLALDADNMRVVGETYSRDRDLKLWMLGANSTSKPLYCTSPKACASLCRSGKWLATGGEDGDVEFWNVEQGAAFRVGRHESGVKSIAVTPDGVRIVTGDVGGTVKVWSGAQWSDTSLVVPVEYSSRHLVAVNANGDRLLVTCDPKTLAVLELPSGREISTKLGRDEMFAEFSPDGTKVVAKPRVGNTPADDEMVTIWDADTGHDIVNLRGYPGVAYCASFSADGLQVVTAAADDSGRLYFCIWETATGRLLRTITSSMPVPTRIMLSPSGDRIIGYFTNYEESRHDVREWDVATGIELLAARGRAFNMRIWWSHTDPTRVLGYAKGAIYVLDAQTGQRVFEIPVPHNVDFACFTPDRRLVAVSSFN